MPTWEKAPRFDRDWKRLGPEQRELFKIAVRKFIEDLERGGAIRDGLRVRGIEGTAGVFEMTWAGDGRATFEYGDAVRVDEPHVVWRRVGTHSIFTSP